ncbi:MAG: aldehyde reductase [Myxococcaceae bacterium]
MSTVLVTGGSGFIGGHVVLAALAAGHTVRTTVRSLKKEATVRATLKRAGADDSRLTFYELDLERDAGWAEAVAGCDFVLHVASPMPQGEPKNPDDVLVPAREGVLRALRFSRDAGVKRVVLTSSCGAVYYGHPPQEAAFDETSWTNTDGDMSTYVRSKALAERAAWDFMQREGGALELSVINPAGVFGPALSTEALGSLGLVQRLLRGMPGAPRLYFSVVDVRDVADLHLRAMTSAAAKGERFIATTEGVLSMLDVANVLRARLGAAAAKAPRRALPSWLVRVLARVNPQLRQLLPLLDVKRQASSAKAKRVLGWSPRAPEDVIAATGESLLQLGAT